jgi:hypothetical protein
MALLIVAAVVSLVSLVTSLFLPDRFRSRKTVLLVVGIVGASVRFAQGYRNSERADDLQNKLDYFDIAKLNVIGLRGLAGPGIKEESPISKLLSPFVQKNDKGEENMLLLFQSVNRSVQRDNKR